MLIIPAIDIQNGCVVRLVQGKLDRRQYSNDPVRTARHWVRQGAKFLHIVDLDGAITGAPKNLDFVKEIARIQGIKIQFGGGVRKMETIKMLLDCGISRVILGTKAIEDRKFLEEAFKKFKDKVIVSVDAIANQVFTSGWQDKSLSLQAYGFAKVLKDMGFAQMIYTDISKDGTLKGPDIKGIKLLLKTGLQIIYSGGISSLDDIIRIKVLEKQGVAGIIIGKALYEGKFSLSAAIKTANQ